MYVVELAFDAQQDRLALRPEHRRKLSQLHRQGKLLTAGPYSDDSGALLIFSVSNESEVDELMADDPYYRANGVTVVRKQSWQPVAGAASTA
jgi:uncharacterized protein YciI